MNDSTYFNGRKNVFPARGGPAISDIMRQSRMSVGGAYDHGPVERATPIEMVRGTGNSITAKRTNAIGKYKQAPRQYEEYMAPSDGGRF